MNAATRARTARSPRWQLLFALLTVASSALAQEREVRLASRTLSGGHDPQLLSALEAIASQPDAADRRLHGVLRFERPLTREQHKALAAEGVLLLSYLENDGYFASIPATARPGRGALSLLRGSDLLAPRDKLDRELARATEPAWFVPSPGWLKVVVELYSDVAPEQAAALVARFSRESAREGVSTWRAVIQRRSLQPLAGDDRVKRISPGPLLPVPLTDEQRALTRSEQAQSVDLSQARPAYRVDGTPVRIGICDDGIDIAHNDFRDVDVYGAPASGRVAPAGRTPSDHGTHVASIAGGSGHGSAGYHWPAFSLRGHAPSVALGDFPPFRNRIEDTYGALVLNEVQITNHSYVQAMSIYDASSVDLDRIVRGDASYEGLAIPARPQVWALGNNGLEPQYEVLGGTEAGYHSIHATAKNTIAVGSVNAPDDALSRFSSLGPTLDGRIKPDVVAAGWHDPTGVRAARAYSQGYEGRAGTSMAAPAVTGIVALLIDQYERTYKTIPELRPSTYKAVLVHTARDLRSSEESRDSNTWTNPDTGAPVQFHAGPDFATGWGRVDAEEARKLIAEGGKWTEAWVHDTDRPNEHCMGVAEGSEVKATLVWDDLPGDTSTLQTVPKLVNDLDLQLVAPDGTTTQPWTVDPLPLKETAAGLEESFSAADVKAAYRGVDRRNNVEIASVSDGAAPGIWRAVVAAHRLPMGSGQRYSLVTSHPLMACPVSEAPPGDRGIRLPNRVLDPSPGIEPSLRAALHGASASLALLQLTRLPSARDRERLSRLGVELRQPLGANAYIARIAPQGDPGGAHPELVRWAGELRVEDKIAPSLWAVMRSPQTALLKVVVHFEPEAPAEQVQAALARFHRGKPQRYGPEGVWALALPARAIEKLAADLSVTWIEPISQEELPLSAP